MLFQGHKLKKLRLDKGLSLNEASVLLGVRADYLCSVEAGRKKNLREETVEKFCELYNVHKHYFYLEDAVLISEIEFNVPEELKSFIANNENIGYIKLGVLAKKAGITPERLMQLIEIINDHK